MTHTTDHRDWYHLSSETSEGLHWSWHRCEAQKKKTCCCLKHWSSHISITIYRTMSWLLTLYIPFYTNSWQQWLGLAFFLWFCFHSSMETTNSKKQGFEAMLLHLLKASYSHPSLQNAEVHFHPFSGWKVITNRWAWDWQDQLSSPRPNPDRPGKNQALREPEQGEPGREHKRGQSQIGGVLGGPPDFKSWAKDLCIYPRLASHCHV